MSTGRESNEFYKRRQKRRQRRVILAITILFLLFLTGGSFTFIRRLFAGPVNLAEVVIPDWITENLIPENKYSRPGTLLEGVEGIVIHYVANPGTSAEQNRNYFANLAAQPDEGGTYASSHFIIDMDGTIIQAVPLTEIAYASNGRNVDTISIECCHPDDTGEFTAKTYESLVRLTAWLSQELKVKNKEIIRHYDVSGKLCPKYFVEDEEAWDDFKRQVKKYSADDF